MWHGLRLVAVGRLGGECLGVVECERLWREYVLGVSGACLCSSLACHSFPAAMRIFFARGLGKAIGLLGGAPWCWCW